MIKTDWSGDNVVNTIALFLPFPNADSVSSLSFSRPLSCFFLILFFPLELGNIFVGATFARLQRKCYVRAFVFICLCV